MVPSVRVHAVSTVKRVKFATLETEAVLVDAYEDTFLHSVMMVSISRLHRLE